MSISQKSEIPNRITDLIETFHYNLDSYKKGSYNETQVRREFIDPFFEELGWDITNKQGYAEGYKDVIHEDAIKVGGITKAPDYCFRIGGTRKFFLEAKKPSVNIKEDIHPAYQLRRYGWSAKLPLSILTDFEEFAVYDCRTKPAKNDKASHSRIIYMRYTEYAQRWDEIKNIFSRESILKGSFDKYAQSQKAKKGTSEVDAAFLQEIERWRDILARNIALRNPNLTQRELNFSVQQTIDRIVFLRICEDRGIESYGRLMDLQKGQGVYSRLFDLFKDADDKYNSGLFHFKKEKNNDNFDCLTPNLIIDDPVLKDIFKNLYYPESPYEFSVLPADILGQVYEKFLGKVIRLTPKHQAVIEEKPEVRKAGGVYYTPTYIVDYIVKNTVGRFLEGKKLNKAKEGSGSIKILDPACGSGSFLIGAYQFLLDWHLEQYINDNPERRAKAKKPVIYQSEKGEWRLTTDERKRILLNSIYGVDIDSQAVEVTKLSLLLKVLEGENEHTIGQQMKLFEERVLPDLANNIKCGNSLIGHDFYDTQNSLFTEDDIYRVNAFDWNAEFPEIMRNGGFDAVVGNPPYVRQETLGESKPYFLKNFSTYQGTADLYVYFIEKSLSLLRSDGFFGFIVSNKWMRANYGKPLRQWMKQQHISEITDFGDLPVFEQASAYPCILMIKKSADTLPPEKTFQAVQVKTLQFSDLTSYVNQNSFEVEQTLLEDNGWSLGNRERQKLLDKLRNSGVQLGEYVKGKIYYGIKTGLNEAFVIDESTRNRLICEDARSEEIIKPFLAGREIKKYQPPCGGNYLIFMPKGWTNRQIQKEKEPWKWLKNTYPAIASHLNQFSEKAQKRCDKGDYWWELRACDYYQEFEKTKIAWGNLCKEAPFTIIKNTFYINAPSVVIPKGDLFLLGLINSKLLWSFLISIAAGRRGGYIEAKPIYVSTLPIRTIDFTNPTDKAHHDQMVSLVQLMLDLHKKLNESNLQQERTVITRQIEATDRQIDQLVYKLYDLTDDEIKIVEG